LYDIRDIKIYQDDHGAYQTRSLAIEEAMKSIMWTKAGETRRAFIGGSDARIIMGSDEAALVRLWREKRGEAELEDLSGNWSAPFGVDR
jgi:predicted phage-related endonuclease